MSLLDQAAEAATPLLRDRAVKGVAAKVRQPGRQDRQRGAGARAACRPGLAWVATYVEALAARSPSYAKRLNGDGRFGEMESLLVQIGAGEYLGSARPAAL